MEKFFQYVSRFTNLSTESKEALSGILKRLELPKDHVLIKPDATCQHIYFIEQGLTRTFYYKDGKDVTDWISAENTIASSIISFITCKPDRRGIELLEPSILYSIHYDDIENLCSQHHEFVLSDAF